jgi:hypothetical protein
MNGFGKVKAWLKLHVSRGGAGGREMRVNVTRLWLDLRVRHCPGSVDLVSGSVNKRCVNIEYMVAELIPNTLSFL